MDGERNIGNQPEGAKSRAEGAIELFKRKLDFPGNHEKLQRIWACFKGEKVDDITKEEKIVVQFLKSLLERLKESEGKPDAIYEGPDLRFSYLHDSFDRELSTALNIIDSVLAGGRKLEDKVFGGADRGKGDYYRDIISDVDRVTFRIGMSAIHTSGKSDKDGKTNYSSYIAARVYGKDAWSKELPKIKEGILNNTELNKPVNE